MSKDPERFEELKKKMEQVADTAKGMEMAFQGTVDAFRAFDERAIAPNLLLLRNITQEEWDKAVAAREKQNKNDFYYGGLMVISSKFKDMGFQIIPRVIDGFVQPFDGLYYRMILAYKPAWKYQLTLGAVLVILLLLVAFMAS